MWQAGGKGVAIMIPACTRLSGRIAGLFMGFALLSGSAYAADPRDPFESFNRGVHRFNEQLDRAVLKPVAEGYRAVVPQFVRQSVSNVFSNLGDVRVGLNNTLQGKFTAAYSDFGRVMINSTLGVLGLFDIASEAGIEKHNEDFGQTLGWWGVPNGPFLMLPFFGPSGARDVVGFAVDYLTDPVTYVDPTRSQNQLMGTRFVDRRAELLDAKNVLDAAALDQYEFLRDAYLQRRGNLIYDGSPPRDLRMMVPPPEPEITVAEPAQSK
jgi:phospholipid-binding lipoprotein MlaA